MDEKPNQEAILAKKGYVTTPQVAEKTGLTTTTIRSWIDEKKVHGVRVGGRWYVEWASLIRYFREQNPEAVKLLGLDA
jgi:excisionase family DNA binding protein